MPNAFHTISTAPNAGENYVMGALDGIVEAYTGERGFLGVRRYKVLFPLKVAAEIGRVETNGASDAADGELPWEETHRQFSEAMKERLEPYRGTLSIDRQQIRDTFEECRCVTRNAKVIAALGLEEHIDAPGGSQRHLGSLQDASHVCEENDKAQVDKQLLLETDDLAVPRSEYKLSSTFSRGKEIARTGVSSEFLNSLVEMGEIDSDDKILIGVSRPEAFHRLLDRVAPRAFFTGGSGMELFHSFWQARLIQSGLSGGKDLLYLGVWNREKFCFEEELREYVNADFMEVRVAVFRGSRNLVYNEKEADLIIEKVFAERRFMLDSVYNITDSCLMHPGGTLIIKSNASVDCSKSFDDHAHTNNPEERGVFDYAARSVELEIALLKGLHQQACTSMDAFDSIVTFIKDSSDPNVQNNRLTALFTSLLQVFESTARHLKLFYAQLAHCSVYQPRLNQKPGPNPPGASSAAASATGASFNETRTKNIDFDRVMAQVQASLHAGGRSRCLVPPSSYHGQHPQLQPLTLNAVQQARVCFIKKNSRAICRLSKMPAAAMNFEAIQRPALLEMSQNSDPLSPPEMAG
ncbi:cytochrome b5-like Heme/Steroid binding domain-containing protein [Colletotrichum orchidophilum]|uniref:Cytochrome b5-like Heme/Steroid binding domain-containing protein n=1 Tax=Colletotrichum orchidophilum TaxID=1209926 RepID=A0A1G4AY80_9PEZI|nr:cytochrome b5-like Heme/Steroid binding domain-containing protein [Colletotrichum orchidophilum]OHE94120.1 cytochrome b5-like Heme/Steroid binding domain-containing protein [Colletotrichum orchidophilum]